MFPQGYFYILSQHSGLALDVQEGQIMHDAHVVVLPQKFQDLDSQLWYFDQDRVVNKNSRRALDVRSSVFSIEKCIVQKSLKDEAFSQEWGYDFKGFIYSTMYEGMVLEIKGDRVKGGEQIILSKRRKIDNTNQRWIVEPYGVIETAANLVTATVPLHKKAEFGQPCFGYGGQPNTTFAKPVDAYINAPVHLAQRSIGDVPRYEPVTQSVTLQAVSHISMPMAAAPGYPTDKGRRSYYAGSHYSHQ